MIYAPVLQEEEEKTYFAGKVSSSSFALPFYIQNEV